MSGKNRATRGFSICHARSISNKAVLPYFAVDTKLAPENVVFRCNLALALVMTRRGKRHKLTGCTGLHQKTAGHISVQRFCIIAEHDSNGVIAHCSRALPLAPDLSDALALWATALTQKLRSQKAQADLTARVALRPKDTQAAVERAAHLAETGQPQGALTEYEQVLPLDPAHVSALSRFAALCPVAEVSEVARKAEGLVHQRPKDASSKAFLA